MNNQAVEQEIQAKGLTAPRVTLADVEAAVASEHYFTALDGRNGAIESGHYVGRETPEEGDSDLAQLGLLTFCVLKLRNGYIVTGESACASPEHFDAEPHRRFRALLVQGGEEDADLLALRAELDAHYDNRIFLSGFITNVLVAVALTFVGDRLGIDLYLVALFAFGLRIFQNVALIRRHFL
mgnify:CR=1 FL=1